MRVLGIDPGSRKTGYAVLEQTDRKITYITSGVLDFSKEDFFIHRLGEIYQQILDLAQEYKPHQVAFESLIYVKSPTALMKLAQARGVMIAALMNHYHGHIFEYSPNLIKSMVVGHGHADKLAVQKGLLLILGLKEFKTHDESDALAIALCHLLLCKGKIRANIGKEEQGLGPQKDRSLRSLALKVAKGL